jgi:hypothetical protein
VGIRQAHKGAMMAKFIIQATKTIHLEIEVEAKDLATAEQIEKELIIDDFEEVASDIKIENISEKETN